MMSLDFIENVENLCENLGIFAKNHAAASIDGLGVSWMRMIYRFEWRFAMDLQ